MKIMLLRHGKTKGNAEHRYLGSTDERLLPEEQIRLQKIAEDRSHPLMQSSASVQTVYISPMIRCRETAEILFPGRKLIPVEGLKECSFGEFEYRNYEELSGNADYQRYIDSGGTCGFPGGETLKEFEERVVRAFSEIKFPEEESCAFVVHGGTIMALLDHYSEPHRDYFDWQIRNGEAFSVTFDGRSMKDITKIQP